MDTQRMLRAADHYAALGLVVIPLKGKIPNLKAWQIKTVVEGLSAVRQRVRSGCLGNIGIVAGRNSGNLFQVDIDGLTLYQDVLDTIPELKHTWTVLTGSGKGVHIYGRADILPPTTLALYRNEHLEIRFKSDGQQCAAPPSVHPDTGSVYKTLVSAPIRHFEQTAIDALIAFVEAHRPTRPVDLPAPREVVILPTTPGSKRAYALKALEGMVTEVAMLTNAEHDPQNDVMHKNVGKLAVFAQRGDLTRSEVFAAMESVMRSNGYIGRFGYRAFAASFESGWSFGMTETQYVPKCYQLPPQKSRTRLDEDALARLARDLEERQTDVLLAVALSEGATITRLV